MKVTELCTGGELFERILEKTESEEGRYSERDAMTLVTKILSAIAYCHDEHNICHRCVTCPGATGRGRTETGGGNLFSFVFVCVCVDGCCEVALYVRRLVLVLAAAVICPFQICVAVVPWRRCYENCSCY